MSGKKTGPTRKQNARVSKHLIDLDSALESLDVIRTNQGERARQREWALDQSAGRKPPEHFVYPEDRPDDNSPLTRTEKRFLDKYEKE